jgi:hypothetical protein
MEVPFLSGRLAAQPSASWTRAGAAQCHASSSASATTFGSPFNFRNSACGTPTPQALRGRVGSVQLLVLLLNRRGPVNAAMPFPDRIFQFATLKV